MWSQHPKIAERWVEEQKDSETDEPKASHADIVHKVSVQGYLSDSNKPKRDALAERMMHFHSGVEAKWRDR